MNSLVFWGISSCQNLFSVHRRCGLFHRLSCIFYSTSTTTGHPFWRGCTLQAMKPSPISIFNQWEKYFVLSLYFTGNALYILAASFFCILISMGFFHFILKYLFTEIVKPEVNIN